MNRRDLLKALVVAPVAAACVSTADLASEDWPGTQEVFESGTRVAVSYIMEGEPYVKIVKGDWGSVVVPEGALIISVVLIQDTNVRFIEDEDDYERYFDYE